MNTSNSSFVLNAWPPGLPINLDDEDAVIYDRLRLAPTTSHADAEGQQGQQGRGAPWSLRNLAEAVIDTMFDLSAAHEGEPAPDDLATMCASPASEIRWPPERPTNSRDAAGALVLFVDFLERYHDVVGRGCPPGIVTGSSSTGDGHATTHGHSHPCE